MTTNRCFICRKKLHLDGWSCKCDTKLLFCSKHRLPFDHNCLFDYKKENQEFLKKVTILEKTNTF